MKRGGEEEGEEEGKEDEEEDEEAGNRKKISPKNLKNLAIFLAN